MRGGFEPPRCVSWNEFRAGPGRKGFKSTDFRPSGTGAAGCVHTGRSTGGRRISQQGHTKPRCVRFLTMESEMAASGGADPMDLSCGEAGDRVRAGRALHSASPSLCR